MVFEYFCIRTSLNQQLRLSQEKATEIIATALDKEGSKKTLADKYFNDVVKITCLLVKDGSEYQFLHKSIQEYFAARYIRRLPEEKAQEFYQRILESPSRIAQLSHSIDFLYDIDSYRAYKYFALPSLTAAFFNSDKRWSELSDISMSGSLVLQILFDVPAVMALPTTQEDIFMHSIQAISKNSSFYRVMMEHAGLMRPFFQIVCHVLMDKRSEILQSIEDLEGEPIYLFEEAIFNGMELRYISCYKAVERLDLQDEIAKELNASDIMGQLRIRVAGMVDLLQRVDGNELLDII
jgi:hypothetical protein